MDNEFQPLEKLHLNEAGGLALLQGALIQRGRTHLARRIHHSYPEAQEEFKAATKSALLEAAGKLLDQLDPSCEAWGCLELFRVTVNL